MHKRNVNVVTSRLEGKQRRLIRAAIVTSIGVCALLGGLPAEAQAAGKERPNVVFIVCDDLNQYVLHAKDSPQVKTPNIDRLAERGVTFANTMP
jgi:hypothetical protein